MADSSPSRFIVCRVRLPLKLSSRSTGTSYDRATWSTRNPESLTSSLVTVLVTVTRYWDCSVAVQVAVTCPALRICAAVGAVRVGSTRADGTMVRPSEYETAGLLKLSQVFTL